MLRTLWFCFLAELLPRLLWAPLFLLPVPPYPPLLLLPPCEEPDEDPPKLPEDIVEKTSLRYIEAFEQLTGTTF